MELVCEKCEGKVAVMGASGSESYGGVPGGVASSGRADRDKDRRMLSRYIKDERRSGGKKRGDGQIDACGQTAPYQLQARGKDFRRARIDYFCLKGAQSYWDAATLGFSKTRSIVNEEDVTHFGYIQTITLKVLAVGDLAREMTKEHEILTMKFGHKIATNELFLKIRARDHFEAKTRTVGCIFKAYKEFDMAVMERAKAIYDQTICICRRTLKDSSRVSEDMVMLLDPRVSDTEDGRAVDDGVAGTTSDGAVETAGDRAAETVDL
ncbi:hypothetical protein Pfo_024404 [Paulownia fortunei]|nr:hypothetical protein Pfo_024404 [Paulownia fortunei]